MRNTITLSTFTLFVFLSFTVHAQHSGSSPKVEETDDYDTFSAIYDEAGFKADVYRSYNPETPVAAEIIQVSIAWKVTEAWTMLSEKEQTAYLEALVTPIENILANGVKVISWDINNEDSGYSANYGFFAVWIFPNEESVQNFEEAVTNADWYTYFSPINISEMSSSPEAVIASLVRH